MEKNFFKNLQKNKNIDLTQQQKDAVLHREGPALVLAVPGAGKTTVLITRAAYLIHDQGVNPKAILSLTFSRAAAQDMKKRFEEIHGGDTQSQPHFSTIHSFAHQVLKKELSMRGLDYHFIEGKDTPVHKMEILKQLYYQFNKKGVKEEALEDLANAISFVKNRMLSQEQMKKHSFDIKNFQEIYLQYEAWKRERRYIDFDDMLTLAYGILKKNIKLCDDYRRRYSYIQVDEGQDTSPIQYALVRLLAHPRQNIFIVADDDQSIYGFRGADPKELIEFNKIYPQGKVFFMEENFRSTDTIVNIAGNFIKGNQKRYEKNLHTQKGGGKPIIMKRANHYQEQIEYLLEEIKAKGEQGSTAILFRNHLSTAPVVDYLLRADIPFSLREGKKYFFYHWATRDMLSFINLALDHTDMKSFENIYYKMNQYISKKNMDIIKTRQSNQSVFDILKGIEQLHPFQRKKMVELQGKFFTLGTLSPSRALEYIEEQLCYSMFLKEREKTRPAMVATGEFILARLKSIARNTSTLVEFLCRLEELERWLVQCSRQRDPSSKILLSTLHGAKGLEFDRVYMIDLVEDQIPTHASVKQWEQGDTQLLEEERRLFYVGMTRAKEELTLMAIHSPHIQKQECSQFIEEVQMCLKVQGKHHNEDQYFQPEDEVQHKKFGKGRIKWVKDNTIAIKFQSHGVKKLATDFCMHNGMLEKV